jgi:hypothetical protein
LKEARHAEDVLDLSPLDAERPGVGSRDLVHVTSHNCAIRPHPDYPAAYQAASFSSGFTIRNLTSALTSEFTGAALGCPGYKITAGDVATVPTTTALTRQIES